MTRAERIDAAIRLVLWWRDQAPPHGGLAAAIHALAFEFHWPLADAAPAAPKAPERMPRIGERTWAQRMADENAKAPERGACERCGGEPTTVRDGQLVAQCPACKGTGGS